MPQYLAGVFLPVHTITYLWSNDILGKIVNSDGFVTDDNAVIEHVSSEITHMPMPTIIRLAGPIASSQVSLEARSTHGLVFAQRHITMRGASHYMLYDGELNFLYNPKPDYAIAGEEDWYFYGVTNAIQ